MERIEEIIVVEGRDDTAALKRAVDCETIETHGYGIKKETWDAIDLAYRNKGIIVFTDPDRAGEKIRKRITEKYPDAKEAFLTIPDAMKDGDIGVENARPEDIIKALEKVCAKAKTAEDEFDMSDLIANGLTGAGSKEKRQKVGSLLGIGYGNGNAFLNKLNRYGIRREDFDNAVYEAEHQGNL